MSVRTIRLKTEYEALQNFRSDVMEARRKGPHHVPDAYRVSYTLRSLTKFDAHGEPIIERRTWIVDIDLPPNYPWDKPEVYFVGDYILHPNVYVGGAICIEDTYKAGTGIFLDVLCEHIGQIIAYQKYNVKSPANPNRHLLAWVDGAGYSVLPTDTQHIRRPSIVIGSEVPNPPRSSGGRITFG